MKGTQRSVMMKVVKLCLILLSLLLRLADAAATTEKESGFKKVAEINPPIKRQSVGLLIGYLSSPHSLVKYDFYYPDLTFCRPGDLKYHNPGLIYSMIGLRTAITGINFQFSEDLSCQQWCAPKIVPRRSIGLINESILRGYTMRMYIGGRMVKMPIKLSGSDTTYSYDIPLGQRVGNLERWLIPAYHNYYNFEIYYTKNKSDGYLITDAVVKPESRRFRNQDDCKNEEFTHDIYSLNVESRNRTGIYYSVKFIEGESSQYTELYTQKKIADTLRSRLKEILPVFLILIPLFIATSFLSNKTKATDAYIYKILSMGEEDNTEVHNTLPTNSGTLAPPHLATLLSTLTTIGSHNLLTIATVSLTTLPGIFEFDTEIEALTHFVVIYLIVSYVDGLVFSSVFRLVGDETWFNKTLKFSLIQPLIITTLMLSLRKLITRSSVSTLLDPTSSIAFILLYLLLTVLMLAGSVNNLLIPLGKSLSTAPSCIPIHNSDGSLQSLSLNLLVLASFIQYVSIYPLAFFSLRFLWIHETVYSPKLILLALALLVCGTAIASIITYVHSQDKGYHKHYTLNYVIPAITSILFLGHSFGFLIIFTSFSGSITYFIYMLISLLLAFMVYTMLIVIEFATLALLVTLTSPRTQQPPPIDYYTPPKVKEAGFH